ncbi:hypothetical protein T492DRAFT_836447 [Pavlovales sp. CCMP2436]|nr:hypothetical protein T492DRAFT_836447 [Pavlovales sp. CCMP2436]
MIARSESNSGSSNSSSAAASSSSSPALSPTCAWALVTEPPVPPFGHARKQPAALQNKPTAPAAEAQTAAEAQPLPALARESEAGRYAGKDPAPPLPPLTGDELTGDEDLSVILCLIEEQQAREQLEQREHEQREQHEALPASVESFECPLCALACCTEAAMAQHFAEAHDVSSPHDTRMAPPPPSPPPPSAPPPPPHPAASGGESYDSYGSIFGLPPLEAQLGPSLAPGVAVPFAAAAQPHSTAPSPLPPPQWSQLDEVVVNIEKYPDYMPDIPDYSDDHPRLATLLARCRATPQRAADPPDRPAAEGGHGAAGPLPLLLRRRQDRAARRGLLRGVKVSANKRQPRPTCSVRAVELLRTWRYVPRSRSTETQGLSLPTTQGASHRIPRPRVRFGGRHVGRLGGKLRVATSKSERGPAKGSAPWLCAPARRSLRARWLACWHARLTLMRTPQSGLHLLSERTQTVAWAAAALPRLTPFGGRAAIS